MSDLTPLMRQYRRIKQKYVDAVLFFRLGDFYEMFEEDAKVASPILNITLTKRHNIPMCGVPYHAARTYISKLLKAGKKIAICEQIALPQGGRGIAQREVVQVVTPGTVVDEDFLEQSSNNYLVAVGTSAKELAIAYIDLSTGELALAAFPIEERKDLLRRELARLAPKELIIQESLLEEDDEIGRIVTEHSELMVNRYPDWQFDRETGFERLKKQLGVLSLKSFGLQDGDPALIPVGVLLDYVEDTSKSLLPHVRDVKVYRDASYLGLDESSQRNLEIVRNLQDGGKSYTLLGVLDHTCTAMGARMLRGWLLAPLCNIEEIRQRHGEVENLVNNQLLLTTLREHLSRILDVERLSSRVAMDRAHAKDLLALRNSLRAVEDTLDTARDWVSPWSTDGDSKEGTLSSLRKLLEEAINEEASILLTEGRLIREGYDSEIDRLRGAKGGSKELLNAYIDKEKSVSGIQNLKVRYNKIIGYYLEVTKSNIGQVPEHFIRKQSLVGSERYTTERLAELESELNNATEKLVELEREIFLKVRDKVKREIPLLLDLASFISRIDCLGSFARAAAIYGYIRPNIDESTEIHLTGSRHPVVEANLPSGEFVPNSLDIGSEGYSFSLITGPNMAGKSTFLRQIALITLMAQAGSLVPAEEARIGIVDRIFCRVGASDNLARGESTFLVEMNETAYILRSASRRSLIIMDEIGRGTSTNDGLAIAWAVSEFLLTRSIKTLFATHFHELTLLDHAKKRNLTLEVLEQADEVIFLKRVRPGAADHSYGVHVAKLAGLPMEVVARASGILSAILKENKSDAWIDSDGAEPKENQPGLFSEVELLKERIRSIDLNNLTPLEALNLIYELQGELEKNAATPIVGRRKK